MMRGGFPGKEAVVYLGLGVSSGKGMSLSPYVPRHCCPLFLGQILVPLLRSPLFPAVQVSLIVGGVQQLVSVALSVLGVVAVGLPLTIIYLSRQQR